MKILIIEDDPSLRELIERALLKERYVVETAENFASAIDKIGVYDYDCVLLDIMLPDGNGLKILEEIKRWHKQINVIIISAKDSTDDKVAGLNLGADDYLAKPFHIAELQARIKSVVRRKNHDGNNVIEFGNVQIFPDTFRVDIDGKDVELNRKEFDILYYFMTRPNYVIDKTVLAEGVWGDYIDQVDNFDFIYSQIKNLRKKMTHYAATADIKAVYGIGYKLILTDE